MSNKIEYELSLNDMITHKLKEADGAANHLEGTMHHASQELGEFGKEFIGALGISFAIFKGVEFVHEGVEAMHALHEAEGQVRAGLESTHGVAGVTFEDMEDDAKSLAGRFKATRAEIFDMQSQLLTFPVISKKVFPETEQAVLDMSTRLHKNFDEVAIMVGKALQDPERGITALRRVGVNFNENQTEVIKKMVETGHIGQAQTAILKELNAEFAGSAQAAADADPLFKFNKLMGSIKLEAGEAAMSLLHELTPALQWIATAIKDSIEAIKEAVHWVKEHKTALLGIAEVIGILIVAYKAFQAWQVISYMWMMRDSIATAIMVSIKTGWATVTGYLTTAQIGLNAAISANPIGALIIAIMAIIGAVIACYNHFAKFRAVLWGVWETVKEFGRIVSDVFIGLATLMHGVMTFNGGEIKAGWSKMTTTMSEAGQRLGGAFKKGFDEGMADFAKDHAAEHDANAPKAIKKAVGAVTPETGHKKETAKATGNKSVNIHIKIDNLIKDFSFNVKNIKEGMNDVKAAVTQTLLSAVNDSQIVAGQ